MPKVGEKYRHYKVGEYAVIALVRHSETHEEMVVYQNIASPEKTWARPLDLWNSEAEWPEGSGTKVPRFTRFE